jgi:ATP-dependent helicase/nuclease subunit B
MMRLMLEREFLGWDRPFLNELVSWLLARREELPFSLVVVPTAQSGRRLREELASAANAVLAPKVVTPGSLLQNARAEAAPDWVERLAWTEALQNIRDWTPYQALLAGAPGEGPDGLAGLATEMISLRRSLQENGLTLASAASRLRHTVEAERWVAMAALEALAENHLHAWKFESGSRALSHGLRLPEGPIILAGVTDIPPLLDRALSLIPQRVSVLIAAPESEAEHFSETGRPLADWSHRPIPWLGTTQVVADPRQQAAEAWKAVAAGGLPSDRIALGTADTEVGGELARTFTRNGWTAFQPSAAAAGGGLGRWLGTWRRWLDSPTLAGMADLLTLPESGPLVGGRRAQKAKRLAEMRDQWMALTPEDLARRMDGREWRSDFERDLSHEVLEAARSLEAWRSRLQHGDLPEALGEFLRKISRAADEEAVTAAAEWLEQASGLMRQVSRGPGFWIELMVSSLPTATVTPPEGRVIDVQGWLELLHEPGEHLVLCGMNEGKVPARGGGEPWLGEACRIALGLTTDADRAARDAYLLRALLEARRDGGRIDVFCGKSGAGGDTLLPSRLLLAATRDELPGRVKTLFREVEPPDAGIRWQADWRWATPAKPLPTRLSVTSLSDYLVCPYRYYLKHAMGMRTSEANRSEWNARDFGNVAHEVLERWGRDSKARSSNESEALEAWFSAELDKVVAAWFGESPPLAVRLQTMALRQRLGWVARVQACEHAAGWEVIEVERKFEIPVGNCRLVGKIDRIDRHREDGLLRVIDYKTGKVDGVEGSHRKKIITSTRIPVHLGSDGPARCVDAKGKPHRWHNLQLPLYAAALLPDEEVLPQPCYFTIGSTAADVALLEWKDFSEEDVSAATQCAEWIAEQIAAGVFWPPAESVGYDDYRLLTSGKTLEEAVIPPHLPAEEPEPLATA